MNYEKLEIAQPKQDEEQEPQPEIHVEQIDQHHKQYLTNLSIYLTLGISIIYLIVCILTTVEHPIVGYNKTSASPITITETIPDILNYTRTNPETYETWLWLINNATTSIDIVAYYSTMFCANTTSNTCKNYAAQVVNALKTAANDRKVKIRMAIDSQAFGDFSDIDRYQSLFNHFQIKYVNIKKLFGGVQHQKILISDQKAFYLGSANFDWRAITEVKEIGVFVNDSNLCFDIQQIFEQLWNEATILQNQSVSLESAMQQYLVSYNNFSQQYPYNINNSQIFIAQAPPQQLTFTRTHDLTAMQWIIDNSKNSIDLQCMTYSPTLSKQYWDGIEGHLKTAALRGVKVRLLIQYLDNQSRYNTWMLINSFSQQKNIQVYMMNMPKLNEDGGWDHTRLLHSKFIVADGLNSIISTSNFEGGYFYNTSGAGIVVLNNSIIGSNLKDVMDRDISCVFTEAFKPATISNTGM